MYYNSTTLLPMYDDITTIIALSADCDYTTKSIKSPVQTIY